MPEKEIPDVDPVDDDPKDDKDPDPVDDPKDDDDKDDKGTKSTLDDAGKKAIDAMKRERNAAKKALADAQAKIKEYADKDKTDTERLTESAEEAKSRASKAESGYKKLQTAIDRAPEGATLTQIKAVAKRLTGDSDEEMEADADELFGLFAPSTSSTERGKAPAGKPKERLRGGGDPEEEPEETDPRKLAALIGRP